MNSDGHRHPGISDAAILTTSEMARADALAVAGGKPSFALMEAAGAAVAREIQARWQRCAVVALCGPGNNGGDGFVAARHLRSAGWPVRIALLGAVATLRGDAAAAAARWGDEVSALTPSSIDGADLAIDALFGAGLSRPVDGVALEVVNAINARRIPCVAVDVPSGIEGDTGQVLDSAPRAALTVTFFRRKPGHVLLPGRAFSGEVVVADIGIPADVLREIGPSCYGNSPDLWIEQFPRAKLEDHKYRRGHLLIAGGAVMTGAARLAARAARRAGAGLVTIACTPATHTIYALDMPGTITAVVEDDAAFSRILSTGKQNTVLIGPGHGVGETTRRRTLQSLTTGRPCVLDADSLSVFAEDPNVLFSAICGPCALTPHEGEFARLFPDLARRTGKIERARDAAKRSGAVILLKGADTVVAAPDGRTIVNTNAPADLATAGSGDVLAGIVAGLFARGMPPVDAAAAAAWLHGECASAVGAGLISEDLVDVMPSVLRGLTRRFG